MCSKKKNNSELTILPAARNIVSIFNQLSRTCLSENASLGSGTSPHINIEHTLNSDFDLYGDSFHQTWLSTSDALISRMLQNLEMTSSNHNSTINRKMGTSLVFSGGQRKTIIVIG